MHTSVVTPRIGISACLLGEPVRFNAGHKQSALCREVLAQHLQFVPLCPELAIGLGTPREPIRLVGTAEQPRARGSVHAELDVTEQLAAYGREVAAQLGDISGFILMQKSPSCGMERVKLYGENGHSLPATASGIFARALMEARPDLPVEEDGRLHDPVLRENFLTRVYAHAQWQRLLRDGLSHRAIVDFHSRYKYQLMAAHPQQYRALGRRVANLREQALEDFAPQYLRDFMQALGRPATRGTHCNVLQHLCGYLKNALAPADRHELGRLIEQYRSGIVPLVVPLTLLKHHLRHHPHAYLERQAYLQPHPEALSLRNAI
ncbi:hypothetical protein YO5_15220 [Stutzerimonas stutzeri TS44]|nr:hypothetical protein YO5_15220 [Stutzerimonas stutzeri TS44]